MWWYSGNPEPPFPDGRVLGGTSDHQWCMRGLVRLLMPLMVHTDLVRLMTSTMVHARPATFSDVTDVYTGLDTFSDVTGWYSRGLTI